MVARFWVAKVVIEAVEYFQNDFTVRGNYW